MWTKKSLFLISVFFIQMILSTSEISEREYALMPTLFHFDNYDNCMLYGTEALFCTITFQLYLKNPQNMSKIWNTIKEISSTPKNYRHDLLRHGICIPETCPGITLSELSGNRTEFIQKLENCYNQKYITKGIIGKINEMRCETNTSPYSYNFFDMFYGAFLIVFIILVLCAWFYDSYFKNQSHEDQKNFFDKFVSSFSLSRNWKRLNTIDLQNPDIKRLRCIQGVRFYNMICIIFGHTVTVNLSLPVSNPMYTETIANRLGVKWIGNGSRYATVQTFFMMSAWLLAYQFFTDLEGKKKVTVSHLFRAFRKRYIRLTPTLVIMIGFYATWMVHLSRGPFWEQMIGEEYKRCRTNWWSNLLYLNNYIHGQKMCSAHHWYVAVDTQLYILGLLLLTLIWYNQKKIIFILSSLWILHIVFVFYIIYINNREASIPLYPEIFYNMNVVHLDEIHAVYKSDISNLGGFIAGVGYGYAFYKFKNQKLFTKKLHVILWWTISWGVTLGIVIFPGLMNHMTSYYQYRSLFNAVYGSLNKSVFVFGIGLWMFGVTQGQGSITKLACEWPPTYILGRLTYSAFLVHTLFQRLKGGIKRTPNYVDDYIMLFETIGDIAITYVGAAFLTLFFEMPIAELKKQLTSIPQEGTINVKKIN